MNEINESSVAGMDDHQPEKFNLKHFLIEAATYIILALVLTSVVNLFTARVRVLNVSMQPTLHQGELLLVSKMAYLNTQPRTGEIIIFHASTSPGENFIKRVIGTPGDKVLVRGGQVYVNDIQLKEDYIASPPAYTGEWEVPGDSLFVMGDNRNSSSDSHSWGFVPMEDVIGKVLLVYWPITEITLLTNPGSVTAAP